MKHIYLIRHGETEWNRLGLGQGSRNDIELNDSGREQAKKTGEYMNRLQDRYGRIDLILCSPMKRTMETAQIIAQHIDYQGDIVFDKNLVENDRGLISIGKTMDCLKQDSFYNDFFAEIERCNSSDIIERNIDTPPNDHLVQKYMIESPDSCIKRAHRIIKILKRCDAWRIIVVTHGGTIEWLNKKIMNSADNIIGDTANGHNCHLTYYQLSDRQKFRLICAPNTLHLKE